jgi:hypothetical protein
MKQLLNIFHSGGLQFIPLCLFLGSVACFWAAYASSKSNSTTQTGLGGANPQIRNNTGNVPMTKSGYFIWGIVLFVAAIVSLVIIANDYKGV